MPKYQYSPGDPNIACDFSGFKVKMSQTVRTWDGFRVYWKFVGEEAVRHPQDRVRGRVDRQVVSDARPEPAAVFLDVGDVTEGDL